MGREEGLSPPSGVKAGTNGEVGGLPSLASKWRQMEREEGLPLLWCQSGDKWRGRRATPSSGIEMGTKGEERRGKRAAPPLASK